MINLNPPTRWPLVPIKRFAQLVYGDALPAEKREDGGEVPVYGSNGVFGSHSSANTSSPVILVGRKGSVGALNWSEQPAFAIDTVYFVDEVHASCDLRWLYWALQTAGLHHLSQDTGVPGLSREMAYGVALPLAPPPVQKAIAAFLDRETDKIDTLVEDQKRLIELLKEKRQAVISHAITKGLDPNACMKPSGVEWPSTIPANWEVLPLTRVVSKFVDYRGVTPTKLEEGVPLITATQIKNGKIDHSLDPVFISENEYAGRMTRGFPEVGDVLLTTEAPLGEVAMIEDPRVSPGQRMILMKVNSSYVTNEFLFEHFRSDFGKSELQKRGSGSTATGIRADRLRASLVLVPPTEEQLLIVQHIRATTQGFEEAERLISRQIELLQERRSSLISSAVTGKIKVSNTTKQEEAA